MMQYLLKNLRSKRELLYDGYFRLRVGDYRIIYTLDNGKLIICVIDAGNWEISTKDTNSILAMCFKL